LPEEAVKSLLSKNIGEDKDVSLYLMPLLKNEYALGRGLDFIERDAYEKGYAAGEKSGLEMGAEKAKILLDRIETMLSELVSLRESLIREAEPQMVELAVSIAQKILMRELAMKPEDIVSMTREALMKIERSGQITIKINPSLYDLFMKLKPQLQTIHPDIVFDVDPSAPAHGSVVMGSVEDVVTDLDDQLRNLIKDMGDCRAAR
jgi:flagellar biosynthesis/type III secretory pathway protein FliH